MKFIKLPNKIFDRGPIAWMRSSVAAKLALAMLGVALVPLAISGVISYTRTSAALSGQVGDSIAETVGESADLAAQSLVENIRLLQGLAGSPVLRDAVIEANGRYTGTDAETSALLADVDQRWRSAPITDALIRRVLSGDREVNPVNFELRRFQETFPRNVSLLVTDRHGGLMASTERSEDYVKSDEGWWRRAWAGGGGGVYLSDPEIDATTGTFVVSIGVPINSLEGQAVGVLSARADVRELLDILSDLDLGETTKVLIVGGDRILFDPVDAARFGSPAPQWLAASGVLDQPTATWARATDETGTPLLVAAATPTRTSGFSAISELGWNTVATLSEGEALAPVITATRLQIVVAVIAALIAVAGGFLLTRLLTRQVDLISDVVAKIGLGDFTTRAEVVTRDEMGRMAQSLNAMLDQTLSLIQTADERDRIQQSVMKLLDEISGVAQGDLTREAEVTPEITGAIADSFNYMIVELRNIILQVQGAAQNVGSSASQIQDMMSQLADGSEVQSEQIVDTSSAIEEMALSIQQVAENAKISAEVAERSLAAAQAGADSVRNTITSMSSIRERVQETAKRIKRLGESTQEIGEIVQLIDDIADRTSILALNASIQAATAGEAGKGFAVVAEEVERLAERASDATKRIGVLVQTIQGETNEAMTAMGVTTEEVVGGSERANQAGQSLEEIEKVSADLAELIQTISSAANQQARGSESLASSMSSISEVTQQAAAGTKQAAVSMSSLSELAGELRESMARFRIATEPV
ncbi:MAG: methyl-accepting chemotaxis protein [Acidobacteriota bacterium]|jgi:methyl-accepting chemotaxis protein